MLTLKANIRDTKISSKDIINQSAIPAVMYGFKQDNTNLTVDYQEFKKALQTVQLHSVFQIEINKKKYDVIIKSYDKDKVKNTFTHIDFYIITADRNVVVPVPVEFTGESAALRVGAILSVTTPRVLVECLPKNIPNSLKADLSLLKAKGDKIRVSDLQEEKNIQYTIRLNTLIAKAELSRAAKQSLNEEESTTEESTTDKTEDSNES